LALKNAGVFLDKETKGNNWEQSEQFLKYNKKLERISQSIAKCKQYIASIITHMITLQLDECFIVSYKKFMFMDSYSSHESNFKQIAKEVEKKYP